MKQLLLAGFFLVAGCSQGNVETSQALHAGALKFGSVVYGKFNESIHRTPPDNDFSRYAYEAKNYNLVIVETDDAYYYSFYLRPRRGHPTFDQRTVFRADKTSSVVEPVASLPTDVERGMATSSSM